MKRSLPVLTLLSSIGVASFNTLLYTGLQWTTAINAFLLQSLMPVLIVALSFLFFREKITLRQAGGMVTSLSGAVTIAAQGDVAVLATVAINRGDIANFHTVFNVVTTLMFLPFTKFLAKIATMTVPAGDCPAPRSTTPEARM